MIPIWLIGAKGRLRMRALVDSGSVETVVPRSFLDTVGASVSGTEVELKGIGAGRFIGNVSAARIALAGSGFEYESRVIASPDGEGDDCILGYRDFFLSFRVTFDAKQDIFYVHSADSATSLA